MEEIVNGNRGRVGPAFGRYDSRFARVGPSLTLGWDEGIRVGADDRIRMPLCSIPTRAKRGSYRGAKRHGPTANGVSGPTGAKRRSSLALLLSG